MNCTSPEELAVVNWPKSSAHDRIVTTKEMIPPNTRFFFCGRERLTAHGPAWWVESPGYIKTIYGPVRRFPIYDMHLRPFDILNKPRAQIKPSSAPKKRGPKPKQTMAQRVIASLRDPKPSHFNTDIMSREESDKTLSIRRGATC